MYAKAVDIPAKLSAGEVVLFITLKSITMVLLALGILAIVGFLSSKKTAASARRKGISQPLKTATASHAYFAQNISGALPESYIVYYIHFPHYGKICGFLDKEYGERYLSDILQRVSTSLKGDAEFIRWNGDEFLLISPCESQEKGLVFYDQLTKAFAEPVVAGSHSFYIPFKAGICFSREKTDLGSMVGNAKEALERAKMTGEACCIHDEAARQDEVDEMVMENLLKRALEYGEFSLHYQPQVNLQNYEVNGVEALLRWNSPVLGNVPPNKFIPVAEKCGFIPSIGTWVVKNACSQLKQWHLEGQASLHMSINISGLQLALPGFIGDVEDVMKETGVNPENVIFEITETVFIDCENITPKILKLKEMGIKIAIDDFGKGYSSLSRLINLPADILKLDRDFIRQLNRNARSKAFLDSILSLANQLGLEIIVEGVETEEQIKYLAASRNYLNVQGFYFSRPVIPADLKWDRFKSLRPDYAS